jgi:four helix bundle protein
MRDFQELKVWRKSHDLTLAVYKSTADFPADERFGLTRQMRRASSSIPCNIAEACGRDSDGEFHRFLTIAMGSACELEYQLLLARDLEYLAGTAWSQLNDATTEVKRMLAAFLAKLKADLNTRAVSPQRSAVSPGPQSAEADP